MGIFRVSHKSKRVTHKKMGFLVFLVDARRWSLFDEKKQRVKKDGLNITRRRERSAAEQPVRSGTVRMCKFWPSGFPES